MKVFNQVKPRKIRRSVFNLSYSKLFDADMGLLYPVMCDEVVPGDTFKIGCKAVIRAMPLVAPVLHEVDCYVHYFYVPYRLLDDKWEDYITGGKDGNSTAIATRLMLDNLSATQTGTLWDYFGFPSLSDTISGASTSFGSYVSAYPFLAYSLVWDDYYRDETFQASITPSKTNITDYLSLTATALPNASYGSVNGGLKRVCWRKDYFTSSLPWQQRGIAPALPLSGVLPVTFDGLIPVKVTSPEAAVALGDVFANAASSGSFGDVKAVMDNVTTTRHLISSDPSDSRFRGATVDLSGAATFNVSDLRLAWQLQRWMERNAVGGVRYTEFLRSHFGVAPRDERLDRPEYIGGAKMPVIFSEVLQTSQTSSDSPQGNLAGHGIAVGASHCGTCFCSEFGLILGLMHLKPKAVYTQGINRQWLRKTRYDYYFPEFAHLSEQAIDINEIYATSNGGLHREADLDIFGYQGRFNEMRYKPNLACGHMRVGASGYSLSYWHLARSFAQRPVLGSQFLECNPDKRIFAVPSESGFIVDWANVITAVRPLPYLAEPGLVDHSYS